MELEIESVVDWSERAQSSLIEISKDASSVSPTGTALRKQYCSYSDGFGLAPVVVGAEPRSVADSIDSIFEREVGNAKAQFFIQHQTSPLRYFTFDNAQYYAELLRQDGAKWEYYGFNITGRFHANLSAKDINSDVFHYNLFQLARKSLLLPDFQLEPFFVGRELGEGSVLFEILFGAATLVGSVAAYPKVKNGFQEAVRECKRLKHWFDKALEKERAFKRNHDRKDK